MRRSLTVAENSFQRLPILSRISLPTTAKTPRNVSEYSIELEDPYRTFSPGDHVRGRVVLNVERPTRITHLTLCLHGVVKVFKNGRVSGESIARWRSYLATGQGKWGEAFFGNGLAALFKDEVILAGDGCLAASSYRFEFSLELPARGLPSSIDFQHGCISYMLSSTLTRPTTLSPTSRCERIITVKENIDLACVPSPIPQAVPLDSIIRKPRRTKNAVASQNSGSSSRAKDHPPHTLDLHSSIISEVSAESPQSPSMSDVSCPSTCSSTRIDNNEAGSVATAGHDSFVADGNSAVSSEEAMVTPSATIEMLQSGCLPGDTIAVRVVINLAKHFKNPQGIILTLYRECHIDIHPAIPLGSWQKGKKQEFEDYYPRSRTGLGGLSLSSGGSSRVFRQDISQKSTALYVDRNTLAANVKASVQAPEDLFPTISSVPGAMIDFKYYVEIIIDLRARSAIQDHVLPRFSMVNSVPSLSHNESSSEGREAYSSVQSSINTGLSFLDTSHMRREKGVVTHVSEIVVGTRDSGRNRSKKAEHNQRHRESRWGKQRDHTTFKEEDGRYEVNYEQPVPYLSTELVHDYSNGNGNVEESHTIDFAPAYNVPPPEVEDNVDEKTRLRRAEEVLLPSAPPQPAASSSHDHYAHGPTAPAVVDEEDFVGYPYQPGPSAPAYDRMLPQPLDANSSANHASSVTADSEDKQELEQRRLQAQVSSPDANASIGAIQATAPALDEETLYASPTSYHPVENLPRYQT
ncbi:MAG: hypothetical protein Q9174_005179 [Haloplaca sp. 1 TL-2023]